MSMNIITNINRVDQCITKLHWFNKASSPHLCHINININKEVHVELLSLQCKTLGWIINISFMNMIWIIIYLQTFSESLIQYDVPVNTSGGGYPWQWQKPVKHILYIIREENMHQFIMLAVSYNTSQYIYLYISSCCFKAFGQTRRDAILNYWSLGCF